MPTEIEKITSEMERLSRILENAKRNEAVLSGRYEEAMKRLKAEFGFSTVKEAKESLSQMQEEIEGIKTEIQERFDTLQEKYAW